jgi:hypothetical protein
VAWVAWRTRLEAAERIVGGEDVVIIQLDEHRRLEKGGEGALVFAHLVLRSHESNTPAPREPTPCYLAIATRHARRRARCHLPRWPRERDVPIQDPECA